jgi:folate-binding Fe-S cluster repair protein YgfZ
VSWTKGCYMGQELTARTKYRALIKRRLMLVSAAGDLPPPGTPITRDGVEVGVMRSSAGSTGLALLRLDAAGGALASDGVAILARAPDWMAVPA